MITLRKMGNGVVRVVVSSQLKGWAFLVMVSDNAMAGMMGLLLALTLPVDAHSAASASSSSADCKVQRAINKVEPATVKISVKTPDGPAFGTGFIWDKSGRVITNHHIVAAGSDLIVLLETGKRLKGTLIADFPERDIAVLQISGKVPEYVRVERTQSLGLSDKIITVGNPLGKGLKSSVGFIKDFDQNILMFPGIPLYGLVQTDIQFKPGNSGGAVFNCSGKVVGMAAATLPRQDRKGLAGFVIPASQILEVMASLGDVVPTRRPSELPVNRPVVSPKTPTVKPHLGLMIVSTPEGRLMVDQVVSGTPAESAGVMPGDIILAADGEPMISLDELHQEVKKKTGESIKIVALRDGRKIRFNILLGSNAEARRTSHDRH